MLFILMQRFMNALEQLIGDLHLLFTHRYNSIYLMASEGRITDKLARYTSDGQLTCAICKITIKSNAAWGLHVTGSMHVEQLKKLTQMLQMQKAAQAQTSTPAPVRCFSRALR